MFRLRSYSNRDGTSKIFLQYCHNSDERVLVDTGFAIPPEYWNRKNSRINANLPEKFGTVKNIETHISEKMRRAEDLINYAVAKSNIPPAKFLKEKFSTDFDPVKYVSVLEASN